MGRAQYNLKIQQDQKSRWMDEVAESDEYDSLSHLIRLSVESELKGGTDTPSPSTGMDSDALGSLNRIETALTDIQERMGALERETGASAQYDLQRVIFAVLPEGRPSEAAEKGIGASDLASRIGAEVSDVRETLQDLAEDSTAVWAQEDDDGRKQYVSIP